MYKIFIKYHEMSLIPPTHAHTNLVTLNIKVGEHSIIFSTDNTEALMQSSGF